jgi:chitin synthase
LPAPSFFLPPCSLEYIKEAVAEADPVTGFAGLIKQRRRWLNGTFFAMIYTLSNWSRIWTESHHRWAACELVVVVHGAEC